MRIGFDGKRAVSNMTGLGNYSRLVIEKIAEDFPEDSLYIYTPKLKKNPRLITIESLGNTEFRLPAGSGFSGSLWRTFGISNNLLADKIDVYHGLSNELPLNIKSSGVPSVVTIHDVIYRRLPECYSAIDRKIYDFKYGRSCHNATRIIAISECTKKDIIELYGIDPEKIDVVYQGCDDSFRKKIPADVLTKTKERLQLPDKYILQVGTIESRKNLELTARALSALPKDVSLLAVGRDRKGYRKKVEEIAASLGVADRVIFRDSISFADLPAVNRLAEVIVYPSRYEGFGIPVIEGLESRRPVVAATGSCLEEAGGDAAIYVNPDDPRQMADAILSILNDEQKAKSMIERGIRHASKFNNGDMAYNIKNVYQKAISDYSHATGTTPQNRD